LEKDFYTKKAQSMFKDMLKSGLQETPSKEQFKQLRSQNVKMLGLPIPRVVVESGDVEEIVTFFENIKATKSYYRGHVLFSISGYDYDPRELYEIKEVVDWIRKLVARVPYIFYYVEHSSWAFMQCCIARRVTSVSKIGDKIDVHEATRRMFTGEEIPLYKNYLQARETDIQLILSGIKLLGSEIDDIKGANAVHQMFSSTFINTLGGRR